MHSSLKSCYVIHFTLFTPANATDNKFDELWILGVKQSSVIPMKCKGFFWRTQQNENVIFCLIRWLLIFFIFSSPEPKAHWWANSIPVTPVSVVRPSVRQSSVNIFKHLLLWNYWANWTHISYGDSLGWGYESLFKWSWSHDQDGRHAHIW